MIPDIGHRIGYFASNCLPSPMSRICVLVIISWTPGRRWGFLWHHKSCFVMSMYRNLPIKSARTTNHWPTHNKCIYIYIYTHENIHKIYMWRFPKIVGFPPKSSILIGFSIINHPFWGPTPIFGNTHIYIYMHIYMHIYPPCPPVPAFGIHELAVPQQVFPQRIPERHQLPTRSVEGRI